VIGRRGRSQRSLWSHDLTLILVMAEGDDAKLVAQVVRDIAGAVKQATV
jgi:hypothetical protein